MFKKFLLCSAAGLTALGLGLAIFYAGEFFVSIFQTSEQETVETYKTELVEAEKIPVEELIYPQPAAVEPETGETVTEQKEENGEFDPDGYYYIIGEQKGFEDVTHFCVLTADYITATQEYDSDFENYRIPPGGHIETNKELNFTRIGIARKKIAFETEVKNGISFEFVGEFVDGEEVKYKTKDGETTTDYAVMKGRLVKKRNGKKIAERIVQLAQGGC